MVTSSDSVTSRNLCSRLDEKRMYLPDVPLQQSKNSTHTSRDTAVQYPDPLIPRCTFVLTSILITGDQRTTSLDTDMQVIKSLLFDRPFLLHTRRLSSSSLDQPTVRVGSFVYATYRQRLESPLQSITRWSRSSHGDMASRESQINRRSPTRGCRRTQPRKKLFANGTSWSLDEPFVDSKFPYDNLRRAWPVAMWFLRASHSAFLIADQAEAHSQSYLVAHLSPTEDMGPYLDLAVHTAGFRHGALGGDL